jgi:hypothetical protein
MLATCITRNVFEELGGNPDVSILYRKWNKMLLGGEIFELTVGGEDHLRGLTIKIVNSSW